MTSTPESRLAVLLDRCSEVKNELAAMGKERVELEAHLRWIRTFTV